MDDAVYRGQKFTEEDLLAGNLGDLIENTIRQHGAKPAFSCVLPSGHFHTLSFDELGTLTDAVAHYLRQDLGLQPGDVVAIQAPNCLAYPVAAFGIMKAGLIITNINPLYTAEETQHQLADSGAKILFAIDLFGDRLAQSIAGTQVEKVFSLSLVDFFPPAKRALLAFVLKRVKKIVPGFDAPIAGSIADVVKQGRKHLTTAAGTGDYRRGQQLSDVALYQYTGGTTGRSKGAELTHRNLVANVSQARLHNEKSLDGRDDVLMLVLPLYHVYALGVGALGSMNAGSHIILVPSPRPLSNLKPVFDTFQITVMPGVNTLFQGLMREDWFKNSPPKSLRLCYSGGAPLQEATGIAWQEMTGTYIHEGYGLTECTCMVSTMLLHLPPKRGTCGIPIPGTELRVVGEDGKDMPAGEPGELLVRGPQTMRGYRGQDAATRDIFQDGWLKTGDVAVIDAEGYISIVDRIKDLVLVSGFNVYPAEIEDVLTLCDAIAEAAVVGAPDAVTGERVVAFVIKNDSELTEKQVIDHCRDHLTSYKVPKTVVFIDELPKSTVGKVLRRELKDAAGRAAAA